MALFVKRSAKIISNRQFAIGKVKNKSNRQFAIGKVKNKRHPLLIAYCLLQIAPCPLPIAN
jgi:hypothetical protein